MVEQRFLNLSPETRDRYTNQLLDIFHNKTNAAISVTDIVKGLEIARGSFYKYFKDIDDVSDYLLKQAIVQIHQDIQKHLDQTGDIFQGTQAYLQAVAALDPESKTYKQLRLIGLRRRLHAPHGHLAMQSALSQTVQKLGDQANWAFDTKDYQVFQGLLGDWVMNAVDKLVSQSWPLPAVLDELSHLHFWLTQSVYARQDSQTQEGGRR